MRNWKKEKAFLTSFNVFLVPIQPFIQSEILLDDKYFGAWTVPDRSFWVNWGFLISFCFVTTQAITQHSFDSKPWAQTISPVCTTLHILFIFVTHKTSFTFNTVIFVVFFVFNFVHAVMKCIMFGTDFSFVSLSGSWVVSKRFNGVIFSLSTGEVEWERSWIQWIVGAFWGPLFRDWFHW